MLISLLILVAFILLVEWLFGWRALLSPWLTLSPTALLLALTLVFASYALRALRLYGYFRSDLPGAPLPLLGRCLRLTLQHNLFNNLLPLRSGELSFPLLMGRDLAIPASRSLPALLWFRLMDLHTLGLLALAAFGQHYIGMAPTGAALLAWLSLPWWLYRFNRRLLSWSEARHHSRMHRWLATSSRGLPTDSRLFVTTWLWTVINWAVKLAVFAWVLRQFMALPAAAALLGALTGDLTSVLPIHGVAGAGTYEAGVVAGLLPFGVDATAALAAAVNLHLFMLAATLLGGALSLLLPGRRDG